MSSNSPNLKDYSLASLRDRFSEEGIPAYRANQVMAWLYQRDVDDLDLMTDLSVELRAALAERYETRAVEVAQADQSSDGTRKLALTTHEGHRIEAVIIPEARRNTLCISTQVGCPLACDFCATGTMGLTRNLTTAEIVDQVCRAKGCLDEEDGVISNVVFMGMGEPLLNLAAVKEAIAIMTDPRGMALAPRRITVSTAGVVPRIPELIEIGPINLAVSLHATTNEVRDVLVPINRKFPLEVLLETLRKDPNVNKKRPVFFEYTLLEGMNDSLEDADRLPDLVRGIPCKINLIPANPHPGSRYRAPEQDVMDRFAARVHEHGMRVTLRRSRGADIAAACGQLANA
ncbi:MAG: 23S rRNA (adenine(2503)-C(2))-methyltransferase RlmN [Myxococcota bacterium]|jgi:23S rRNA (adenine2503-C2)-methyltransferase|nr:23S rRNA (adenine(2503)-C(2))-methyltransferase RlmN [Myxococcota bacterium]